MAQETRATPPGAVVVVGASAGGVEALSRLAAELDDVLGAPVCVVLHVSPGPSSLPQILGRSGGLRAAHARNGEPLLDDRIYVAPPDRHMLVDRARLQVVRGPHENGHRPAIDPLFRSAAVAFGPRTIAVVLSGTLDDGSAGCRAVARRGGVVIVQDPEEAVYPSMPLHAIAADHPDHVVGLATMGTVVRETVERVRSLPVGEPMQGLDAEEAEVAQFDFDPATGAKLGEASPFGCPTCGGVLRETEDAGPRFRCRVGHAFGADSLLHAQSETLDDALWMALRALEERAELATRVGGRLRERGHEGLAGRYDAMQKEAEQAGATLRELLLGRDADPD